MRPIAGGGDTTIGVSLVVSAAKLSDVEVAELRRAYVETPASLRDLAARHAVSTRAVGDVLRGRSYAHVGMPAGLAERIAAKAGRRQGRRRLTPAQVLELRRAIAGGEVTWREAARRWGVSQDAIRHAVRGWSYKEVGGPLGEAVALVRPPRFSRRQRLRLAILHLRGTTKKELAWAFGTTPRVISTAIRRAGADLEKAFTDPARNR